MMLSRTQINKIKKSLQNKTGMDLKISKSQIRKSIVRGGSLFTSLLSLGSKLLPIAAKVATKVLPGLASGALTSLGSFTTNKILGSGQKASGIQNRPAYSGGYYHIPFQNLPQLANVLNLLNKAQKQEYLKAVQKIGSGMNIKLTKTQSGGFLGTLLASIGIPLLLKAITGSGLQNRLPNNNAPPPFLGTWGEGLKKRPKKTVKKKTKKIVKKKTKKIVKKKTKKTATGLILGKNSPFNEIPWLGAIL